MEDEAVNANDGLLGAAAQGDLPLVQHFLEVGGDVNAATLDGTTALGRAAAGGHANVVQFLVQAGADINRHTYDGATPLYSASGKDHIEVVKLLIQAGADVNYPSNSGWTPLYNASNEGHAGVAMLLIQAGADLNQPTKHEWTPLNCVSFWGYTDIAKLLIQAGAELTKTEENGSTPLITASDNGRAEVVKLLIQAGEDVNQPNNIGCTPLNFASSNGNADVIELLIQAGADINQPNNYGVSPLRVASGKGHIDVVELLIQAGADLTQTDSDGWTPLHEASSQGQVDVVRLLSQAGADFNQPCNDGWTPLNIASSYGHATVVKLLIQAGADLNQPNNTGWTPLNNASEEGHVYVIGLLIQAGVDLHQSSTSGWTPLHSASSKGHIDIVQRLIHAGAQPNLCDNDGWTPLKRALNAGHSEVVHYLLQVCGDTSCNTNVDPKASMDGNLPSTLLSAAETGNIEMLLTALASGADPNISHKRTGETALHVATRSGHVTIVQVLLDSHAIVDLMDNHWRTPLHVAASQGNDNIVQILAEANASLTAKTRTKSPVVLAYENGHPSTVELLLQASKSKLHGPLHHLASIGDEVLLEVYLHNDPNQGISQSDENQETPLHVATRCSHDLVITRLLDVGADVNAKTREGSTPLHYAVLYGYATTTQVLLRSKPDVNSRNHFNGQVVLHYCINLFGTGANDTAMEILELLLQAKPDVNCQDNVGRTPLHLAVRKSAQATLRLLQAKASIALRNNYGKTALNIAIDEHHTDIIRMLTCDTTPQAWLAQRDELGVQLLKAINTKNVNEVARLLKNGADPNHVMPGLSLLVHAVLVNIPQIVQLLLDHGSNVVDSEYSSDALRMVVSNGPFGMNVLCRLLRKSYAIGDTAVASLIRCALHDDATTYAHIFYAWHDAVKMDTAMPLVDDEIKVFHWARKKEASRQQLIEAIDQNDIAQLSQLLSEFKIAPNTFYSKDGRTVLGHAIAHQLCEISQTLLACGADPSRQYWVDDANKYCTPLKHACIVGSMPLVQMLVEAQSGTELDLWGAPLEAAVQGGHEDIVRYLVQVGSGTQGKLLESLRKACLVRHLPIVAILLQANSISDVEHWHSLLLMAKESGNDELEKVFAAAQYSHKISHELVAATEEANFDQVQTLLLDQHVDCNAQNQGGDSCLHIAVGQSNHAIVQALVQAGANVNLLDQTGLAPLHKAAAIGDKAIVQTLMTAGALANVVHNDGYTPLSAALSKGHVSLAGVLLGAQANWHLATAITTPDVAPARALTRTVPIAKDGDLQCFTNQELGRGAYGVVYKGHYQGRNVAIKTIFDPKGVHMLLDELEILARLDSPFIIKVLCRSPVGAAVPQMVLEWMDGGSLHDYLAAKAKDQSTIVQLDTVQVASAIISAVVYIHGLGLMHRDLKSDNILLSTAGDVKVADFGIARPVSEETMTQGAGTLLWTAPEVLEDGRYNQAADIYSFGVILTELETLQVPYADLGLSQWALIDGVREGTLRPSLNADCAHWYRKLVNQCLAHDPSKRPTAQVIYLDLESHRHD